VCWIETKEPHYDRHTILPQHEETNQPIAPCQKDLDMKVYREELARMRTMIGSMNKSFGLCILSMKDKSSFNSVGPVSSGVYILDS